MYGYSDEEIAKLIRENVGQVPAAETTIDAPLNYETTVRADRDRFKTLAKQLGILTDPVKTQDYSDRIGALADQISQGRVTQEQIQDAADKQAAISFLTNPGRSVFYGGGQATDVTPYSIEGNHRLGESLMKRVAAPIAYADRLREYNKEDLDKLGKVQNLELSEMEKKNRIASSIADREMKLQGLKLGLDQNDPNSSMSKDAVKIFQSKMDDEIAKMAKNNRPEYRALAETYAKAKIAADGKSFSQLQGMIKDREGAFKEAHDMIDQNIKEKYGEQMAAVAGIKARTAADAVALPKHDQISTLKEMNKIKSAIDGMSEIGRIKSNVQTGIMEGPVKSALSKLGIEYNDFRELKAGVARIFNKETKEIAGSAVTASEWSRLEPSIPSVNDDDAVFVTKLKKAIVEMQRILDDKVEEFEYQRTGKVDLEKYRSRVSADAGKLAAPPPSNPKNDPGYHGDVVQQNGVPFKWSISEKKYKRM